MVDLKRLTDDLNALYLEKVQSSKLVDLDAYKGGLEKLIGTNAIERHGSWRHPYEPFFLAPIQPWGVEVTDTFIGFNPGTICSDWSESGHLLVFGDIGVKYNPKIELFNEHAERMESLIGQEIIKRLGTEDPLYDSRLPNGIGFGFGYLDLIERKALPEIFSFYAMCDGDQLDYKTGMSTILKLQEWYQRARNQIVISAVEATATNDFPI